VFISLLLRATHRVPLAIIVLAFFDPSVTMADGDDLLAGDHQVGIHQAGQSSDDDVSDIGGNKVQAFSIEVTHDGAVVISSA
jgi:hypothetical protein